MSRVQIWASLSVCVALSGCEQQRVPAPHARPSAAPLNRTLPAKPTPRTPDPALQAVIAADRANEFEKLSLFLAFAGNARKAPDRVSGIAECSDGAPNSLCSKIYAQPGWSDTWLVSYAKAQPSAFRVQAVFGNVELVCSDLGASSVVRSWQVGSARKQRCAISAGPLAGLEGIIENYPGNSRVLAFSKAYLDHDAAFENAALADAVRDVAANGADAR